MTFDYRSPHEEVGMMKNAWRAVSAGKSNYKEHEQRQAYPPSDMPAAV